MITVLTWPPVWILPKITPFLWFDGQAEEAVAFYLSTGQSDWSDPVSHRSM